MDDCALNDVVCAEEGHVLEVKLVSFGDLQAGGIGEIREDGEDRVSEGSTGCDAFVGYSTTNEAKVSLGAATEVEQTDFALALNSNAIVVRLVYVRSPLILVSTGC